MNNYKIYQLFSFFAMKFSYKTLNFNGNKQDELWLINPGHQYYPLIRITSSSIETVMFEEDRIRNLIDNIFKRFKIKNGRFLDIHVGQEEILDIEKFDSISLDQNYYSGIEVNDIYPGIHNVVHEVSDPNLEIASILKELNEYGKQAKIQKRNLKVKLPIVTTVTMVICIIMYLITVILEKDYGNINTLIVLGANYKTFTVGLYEFYRLVTAGFLHGGIFHLLMNMLALYNMGRFMEKEIGSLKFGVVLYGSVIIGSLTSLLFGDNGISVGLSGGLYGLMGVYLMIAYKNHQLNNPATIQVILINLMINFMGGVDVFAHLGGLVAGIIFYYTMFENKRFIVIYILVLVLISIKVYTVPKIEPKYAGTDMKVVEMYQKLGFEKHADKTLNKLLIFYGEK